MNFYLQSAGIGPWFVAENVSFRDTRYRGKPAAGSYAIGLANWGDMQLELIQPLDDQPSIYREHLQRSPHNNPVRIGWPNVK